MTTPNTNTIETAIPFSGFYESWHSGAFDSFLESESEYYTDELKLDRELVDSLIHSFSFKKEMLKEYCEKYLEYIEKELEIKLEYSAIQSPKFYNYGTDCLFANIKKTDINRLYVTTHKAVIQDVIKRRFTSYEGFTSHYSDDLKDWPSNPLEWDHNQLETLLIAYIEDEINEDSNEFELGALDHIQVNELDSICDCFDQDIFAEVNRLTA